MKKRNSVGVLVFCLIGWVDVCANETDADTTSQNRRTAKPNVVLLLADDLGYGDVQPLNPDSRIATPNFERLAREGMTFVDAHSASAVCTPTRYSLLCGRYSWRTNMKQGVLGGYSPPLMQEGRQTIATVMKHAGYQTGCVGKWHLGLGWQWRAEKPGNIHDFGIAGRKGSVDYDQSVTSGPNDFGFDYSHIIPASLDMSPYVYVHNGKVVQAPDRVIEGQSFPRFFRTAEISPDFKHVDTLDHLLGKAQQFIKDNAKKESPFFLYFPLSAPHKPVMTHPRFQGKTELGTYGDFIVQVDWTVGQILKTLDDQSIADETLVIVTSDNGSFMYSRTDGGPDQSQTDSAPFYHPDNHRSNGPLRGTKADIWDGGHRVPFFVRWPGQVGEGKKDDTPICQTDILATLAEIAGVNFDHASAEDSFSFRSLLIRDSATFVRPPLIHQSGSGHLAIRDGKWKLVLSNGSGGREPPQGSIYGKPYRLFDLSQDIGEQHDLAAKNDFLVEQLTTRFEDLAHGDQIQAKNSPR